METPGANTPPKVFGHTGMKLPGRGWIASVPQDFAPMQTVLTKVPRPDACHAGVYWLAALAETWRPIAEMPGGHPTEKLPKDPDVLVLRNGWTPCAPGFFGAIGYPEDAQVDFKTTVAVPSEWGEDQVDLVMHCGFRMRGLSPYGTVSVNGQGVPGYAPFSGFRNGGQFAFDVTELAKGNGGKLDIVVSIDGTQSRDDPDLRGRPNGAGATFALHRRRKAGGRMALENWRACMDYGDQTPVKPGQALKHRYFETEFSLPPEADGKRVFLAADTPLRGIMLNGKVLNVPDLQREIDVTGLLDPKGKNLLRWVDGTLHGISFQANMIDRPVNRKLGNMELHFKNPPTK